MAYLNSAYQDAFKNLTDQAIICAYEEKVRTIDKKNLNDLSINKIKEIPFDFSRRKVTVVYEILDLNMRILITKGAVYEMLDVCKYCLDQNIKSNDLKENEMLPLDQLFKILKNTKHDQTINDKPTDYIRTNDLNSKLVQMTPEMIEHLHLFNNNLNENG